MNQLSVLDINSSEDANTMFKAFKNAGCSVDVSNDLTLMLRVVNALPLENRDDRYKMIEFMLQEYFSEQSENIPTLNPDEAKNEDTIKLVLPQELHEESDVIQLPTPAHGDIEQVDIEVVNVDSDSV